MTTQIAPRMARKRIVKDLNGGIVDMLDEVNGGYIVRNRQVVNPEKWAEHLQKEEDRRKAAVAQAEAIANPTAPDRNINPSQQSQLKQEFDDFKKEVDGKLNAILEAVSKK